MKSQTVAQYDAPHQFEPLMPAQAVLAPLLEKAGDLMRKATALGAAAGRTAPSQSEPKAPSPSPLRHLLRSMNSYYTNRIEGEHTRPSDIERALQQDFSANADLARKQRLAVAHIRTEALCEQALDGGLTGVGGVPAADDASAATIAAGGGDVVDVARWLYAPQALTWLHRELFGDLPSDDLRLADGTALVPGQWRQRAVAVGRHEAPAAASLRGFLARWREVYAGTRRGEEAIVALAAAHHRLAWMHPFLDGNGRVARLHTHLLLHAWGLTGGLWSPLRGFARTEARYKALLQAADEHRQGDLDGRGNLTQAGLVAWIDYTLEVCIDQVDFMASQLDVQGMQGRIRAALAYEVAVVRSGVREEALLPLHYLFATQGELGRAAFKTMTGLGDRLATATVSALLDRGFLSTDSPYGSLRLAIPRHALRFYFPALWPEAEQDQALLDGEVGLAPVPRAAPRRRSAD
jgi:Fic family protein